MRLRLLIATVLPALLLVVVMPAARQAAADQLLFNGDFSQGRAGWVASAGLGFETDCEGYVTGPGARLHLEQSGAGWLLSNAVPIEPGGTYQASGFAHFTGGSSDELPQLYVILGFYQTADDAELPFLEMLSRALPPDTSHYALVASGHAVAPPQAGFARLKVRLVLDSDPVTACVDDLSLSGPPASPTRTPTPTIPPPSPTPAPSPTLGPTATATEVPMPSGSILNGGFEEGQEDVPAAWQKFGGFLYRSAASPRSGSFAGAFSSATSSTKWAYQPLVVEPGRSYAFHGFVLKNGPPESTVLLRISWYASQDASGEALASADSPESITGSDPSFRYLSTGSVTAPPEARSARARIVFVPASSAPETIYLDDFALEETAPPTPTPAPTSTDTPTPSAATTPFPEPTETASALALVPRGSLRNGGFEEGEGERPAVWQKFGGFLRRSPMSARSGSFVGAFSSTTSSTKWVYQPLAVEPGRSYTFHGFVLNNAPPESTVLLRISWYSTPDASGASFANSDSPDALVGSGASFRHLSTGSVAAPLEAHSARARIILVPASAAPETIYLDDFAFQESAPATPAGNGEREGEASTGDETAAPQETGPSSWPVGESGQRSGQASAASQTRERPLYQDSPYAIKISEVLANAGRGPDDAGYEWVELYNAGPRPVELDGWSLADNVAADALPPARLAPGQYAVVTASTDLQRQYPAFQDRLLTLADGRIGNGLANEGDRLLLLDEEGRPVDALSYGSDGEFFEPPAPAVAPGHSLERFPPERDTDTAADFRDSPHPSPGKGPEASSTPTATTTAVSEVRGQALSPTTAEGVPWWPWLLASALVFVGGSGVGVAGVLFWLARGTRS